MQSLRVEIPKVETYQRNTTDPNIRCEVKVKLNIVKSIPELVGDQNDYVALRQSAVNANEIFKPYQGSKAHYQAVIIIRNKIRGVARALLDSHMQTKHRCVSFDKFPSLP